MAPGAQVALRTAYPMSLPLLSIMAMSPAIARTNRWRHWQLYEARDLLVAGLLVTNIDVDTHGLERSPAGNIIAYFGGNRYSWTLSDRKAAQAGTSTLSEPPSVGTRRGGVSWPVP